MMAVSWLREQEGNLLRLAVIAAVPAALVDWHWLLLAPGLAPALLLERRAERQLTWEGRLIATAWVALAGFVGMMLAALNGLYLTAGSDPGAGYTAVVEAWKWLGTDRLVRAWYRWFPWSHEEGVHSTALLLGTLLGFQTLMGAVRTSHRHLARWIAGVEAAAMAPLGAALALALHPRHCAPSWAMNVDDRWIEVAGPGVAAGLLLAVAQLLATLVRHALAHPADDEETVASPPGPRQRIALALAVLAAWAAFAGIPARIVTPREEVLRKELASYAGPDRVGLLQTLARDRRAQELLATELARGDQDLRREVAWALLEANRRIDPATREAAWAVFEERAADQHATQRLFVVQDLDGIDDDRACAMLRTLTSDRDPTVAKEARKTLERALWGRPGAILALIDAPDPQLCALGLRYLYSVPEASEAARPLVIARAEELLGRRPKTRPSPDAWELFEALDGIEGVDRELVRDVAAVAFSVEPRAMALAEPEMPGSE